MVAGLSTRGFPEVLCLNGQAGNNPDETQSVTRSKGPASTLCPEASAPLPRRDEILNSPARIGGSRGPGGSSGRSPRALTPPPWRRRGDHRGRVDRPARPLPAHGPAHLGPRAATRARADTQTPTLGCGGRPTPVPRPSLGHRALTRRNANPHRSRRCRRPQRTGPGAFEVEGSPGLDGGGSSGPTLFVKSVCDPLPPRSYIVGSTSTPRDRTFHSRGVGRPLPQEGGGGWRDRRTFKRPKRPRRRLPRAR